MLIVWVFLSIKSLPNLLFGVLCLPGDQSHPFAQPTINPLARSICWAGLLGRTVFPPWNEGPNSGSYISRGKDSFIQHYSGNSPAVQCLGLTGLISLQSKGLSRVFSSTTVQRHQFFSTQHSLQSNSQYMTTGKTIALTIWTFIGKVMSLLFNMVSRFVLFFQGESISGCYSLVLKNTKT